MRDDVTAYQILEWSLWNDGTTKSAEGLENFLPHGSENTLEDCYYDSQGVVQTVVKVEPSRLVCCMR